MFKLTICKNNLISNIKGSVTYNIKIICILTIKLTTKTNIIIKKGSAKIRVTCL